MLSTPSSTHPHQPETGSWGSSKSPGRIYTHVLLIKTRCSEVPEAVLSTEARKECEGVIAAAVFTLTDLLLRIELIFESFSAV